MGSRPRLPLVAIVGSVVAVDQVTKWWALHTLDDRDIDLVGTLRLHLVMNKGSAFGFGSRFTPLITLVAIAVVMLFLRTGTKLTERWPRVAMALVVGGALGNLTDRIFRVGGGLLGGAVVDFLDLQWWPVFNVADVAISVGAILLVVTAGRDVDGPPDTGGAREPDTGGATEEELGR